MRKTEENATKTRPNERGAEPARVATSEEAKHAADRAIECNREALTELAKW